MMRPTTKITAATGILLAALSAASGVAAADEASPLEQTSASTQSAVAHLETTWSAKVYDTYKLNGEQMGYVREKPFTVTSRCTGFVVNPDGYVATAGHCVEFDEEIERELIEQATAWTLDHGYWAKSATTKGALSAALDDFRLDGSQRQGRPDRLVQTAFGISLSGESASSVLPARVLSAKGFDKGDVALLKVEAENLPSLELAEDAEIGVGTEVTSVGFDASVDLVTDASFDPLYEPGEISSVRTIDDGLLQVYAISSNMNGGMSGGPTINDEGEVVGLNSFGIRGESQSSNFIRPVSILAEVLSDKGVVNETGEVHGAFLAGLDAYFAGDKASALEQFDRVLAQVPSHEIAQQYRAKAALLPDPAPVDRGGLPLVPLGVGAALLVAALVAGGIAIVAVKSRATRSPLDLPTTVTLPDAASPEAPADPGAAVTPPSGQATCRDCGTQQQLGTRFCPHCGTAAEPSLVD